jgi:hypothetical protein
MYHPGYGKPGQAGYVAEDTRKEYIELHNRGASAVNLKGWRLDRGLSFTFPEVTVEPGGYLVVSADTNINRFRESYYTNYPAVAGATIVGAWTGKLNNNGDEIELYDNLGNRIDYVAYSNEGDWALRRPGEPFPGQPTWWRGWRWTTGADAGGKSLELINPALPADYGQNWAAGLNDGGTPGGPNSVALEDTAPVILDVKHMPALPQSTSPVTVTARVVDEPNSNITVTLHHRLDGAADFNLSPMFDDGQHGDGIPHDNVFGVILPPMVDRTIVEFYVEATDAGGKSRTWPGPTDSSGTQGANALYQVNDTLYAGTQPVYYIIIPAAEWAEWLHLMDNVSNGRYSDAQMNATLVAVDGTSTELRYNVGVRNRGKGTRSARPHNLYVSIPADRPWRHVTSLALNTRTVHSQVAANAISSLAGLPNAYGAPVQVRINATNLAHLVPTGDVDSYQFGSYYCLQPYNHEWARDHFPRDANGNLYRGTWYFDWVKLRNPADLNYLGDDARAYRQVYSPSGPTSDSGGYAKQSNVAEDDWSDLITLVKVLNQTPHAAYAQSVEQVVNVDEWLRYLAVTTLIGNMETTLGTGTGDDYSLYRGIADPRFHILPHDLDTTLGQGDISPDYARSIFRAAGIPALAGFLRHPEFAPRYYALLKRLIDTTFSPTQLRPVLDQCLGGWVPETIIQSMEDFVARRNAAVLAQIPLGLTVASNLPLTNGYPLATTNTVTLTGKANAILTRSVLVNGRDAAWTQWSASWSAASVPLLPGVNRVLVQALDSNRQEIDRATIDIWFDNGTVTTLSGGAISTDTVWSAAAGPCQIIGSLTVAKGATLTIEPGTTVYLNAGVNLIVADGGRLLAEGTEARQIRFTSPPGSTTAWGGITINGSVDSPETRLAYVHFEGNANTCLELAGGTLYLDHASFGTTTHPYLSLDAGSFVISHCHFPSATAPFELVHGTGGIKSGGHGLFLRNFFGAALGYNDVIDFTGGNRPDQPIVHFLNNVFAGASDDHIDLDGTDAWVQGNLFLHAHKNGSPDTSSGVSGGSYSGRTSEVTIIGNIFYDCDQAAMAKQGDFFTLLNNTIVHQTHQGGLDTDGAVICLADEGTAEGAGMYLEGNIIYDAEKLMRNRTSATVTFTNNLMPFPWIGPGGSNSTEDPRLEYIPQPAETYFTSWEHAQIMRDWFSLRPGSPGLHTGPNGLDQGAIIPLGVSISGEPTATTSQTSATLTAGAARSGNGIPASGWASGSGYTHYKWRLDSGSWSGETPSTNLIYLSHLANGPHHVELTGRSDSGWYQDDPAFGPDATVTLSHTWIVNTNMPPRIRLNEILAANDSAVPHDDTFPDLIELYNEGAEPADLSGMGITDNPTDRYRFSFPSGTTLAAKGYLVLFADTDAATPGIHLGFALSRAGDAVYLYDRPSNGGTLLDSIQFGLQVPDLSIGRFADGQWGLTKPTFGTANVPQSTAEPERLRINEWLTRAALVPADFIELYNPEPLPVPLGGLFLTDNPVGWPDRHQITPLSYIAGAGLALFLADGQIDRGADHLGFALASENGMLGLFTTNLQPIDVVIYASERTDVSHGRSPNGAPHLMFFSQPTPGGPNQGSTSSTNITTVTLELITITNIWNFNESSDPGTLWFATNFLDTSWPSGPALFYVEDDALPAPKNTPLTLAKMAYYFRTHFPFNTNKTGFTLSARTVIDDGAVFYLNGKEVLRLGIAPDTAVNYSTPANRSVNNANYEGPFTIPADSLIEGDNLMAVEVHQINSTSSDIAFGMTLTAVMTITNNPAADAVPVLINEVLAHNISPISTSGPDADWIELYNPSTNAVDLADLSLSDDITQPRKFVFPPSTIISPRGFLLLACNSSAPASATNTGFGLETKGGRVALFNAPTRAGGLLDSVTYGLQLPGLSIGRIPDGALNWALNAPSPYAANVAAVTGDASLLKVNEWMADPASGDDWFELFNPNPHPVALSGLFLTDNLTLPNQSLIQPLSFIGSGTNAFLKFVADGAPSKGPDHVNFKLSAAGETIALFTADGGLIDAVTFGQQQTGVSQGRLPDGSPTIVTFPATPTPGESNSRPLPGLAINEVLTHADPPFEDAIEFFNANETDQPVGGWFLSNSPADFRKYRLPDNAIIPAKGFLVIYEYQFNGGPGSLVPFTFDSAHGDQAWLAAADANGNLTGYRLNAAFGPAASGVSFGRYLTSTGEDFVAMTQPTLGTDHPATVDQFRNGKGAPNAPPLIGPVVVNEIMFHPPDSGSPDQNDNALDEFVELQNITTNTLMLFDPADPTNTWKITGGLSYKFPTNLTLAPNSFGLLVSFNPTNAAHSAAFRTRYGVADNIPLLGPYSGKLNNSSDSIELRRPDTPLPPPHPDAGFVPYLLVERINYSNSSPWPTGANATGLSLQRRVASNYGNDPLNWKVAAPTAGRDNLDTNSADTDGDGIPDDWEIAHGLDPRDRGDAALDQDADGLSNLQEYLAGTDPIDPQSRLTLTAAAPDENSIVIRFTAVKGRSYTVQYRTDLFSGQWQKLQDVTAQPATGLLTVDDPTARGDTQRFYRLVTPAVP